jgi:hypothetical protein
VLPGERGSDPGRIVAPVPKLVLEAGDITTLVLIRTDPLPSSWLCRLFGVLFASRTNCGSDLEGPSEKNHWLLIRQWLPTNTTISHPG